MLYQSPPPPPAAHILTFAETLDGGGVERAMLRMITGWIEAGRRVTLVAGDCSGPLSRELPPGVELVELGSRAYVALFALAGHIRRLAPDIVFCPGNYYSLIAAVARWRLGAACPPMIVKVSNALVRPEMNAVTAWGYRQWLRMHPGFVDMLVAMSPAMAEEAATTMRMPRERICVIPNPPARRIPGVAAVALPQGKYLLGVGRLEPQKRWDRLIAALPRIADRTIPLVILGEGSARAELEAQVAALGLGGRVTMPGHAGDPLPVLAGAAATVLTSDFEGVPGVLRESLSQGTPVISTESSVAVREIIHAPELGSIVPREDGDALVAAIDHWLAPGQPRPAPVPDPARDSVADYLALFDTLAAVRQRSR